MRMMVLFSALIITCGQMGVANGQVTLGPVATAMGGAGRAAVDPGESAFLNPASLAHLQRYYISGHYTTGFHPLNGNTTHFGALLADGSPGNLVAGSFSYSRRHFEFEGGGTLAQQDFQLSIAGFVFDQVALGVSGHRLLSDLSGVGDNHQDNMHVGLLYNFSEQLGLGVVYYDFLSVDEKVPLAARLVPAVAVGSHLLIKKMFRARLDLVRPQKLNDGNRTNVHVGVESFFREDFAFRLGGRWQEVSDQFFMTAGLGFLGPRLSVGYAFERDVRTGDGNRHMIDIWLPI